MPIFLHSNFDGAANERPQFSPLGPAAPFASLPEKIVEACGYLSTTGAILTAAAIYLAAAVRLNTADTSF